jgi:hypothetical protein
VSERVASVWREHWWKRQVAAAWLGLIEGLSAGLSDFAKMASGYHTDKLRRRKPIAVAG